MVQLHILTPDELRARVDEFMQNGGEELLRAAMARAAETCAAIREALRIDHETLHQPMTI